MHFYYKLITIENTWSCSSKAINAKQYQEKGKEETEEESVPNLIYFERKVKDM